MDRKLKIFVIIIPFAIALGFGIYSIFNTNKEVSLTTSTNDVHTIVISKDFPQTSSLEDMIKEADVVVIGNYESLDSTWKMARNPEDITREDTENVVEGRLYNFRVDEVLKRGKLGSVIKVNHRYSEFLEIEDSNEVVALDGTIKTPATKVTVKEVENKDPLFIEPILEKKYMLFLKKDEDMNNYFGAIEPFSIRFDENDKATLQSNLIDLDETKLSSQIVVGNKTFILQNEIENTITDTITGKSVKEFKKEIENSLKK